ncbi:ABC transporter substrate-binding protein [Paenibacillus sp. F6_3S_P_1C]|uniref:ABC transporter substrate-binding protein n=1 Tax=Paenibacillus vandeheii TaxID=3035917 RepID=A0ABT8JCB1_9BACL|nr:ABC transporter substrate-binding protein [Paenibacillus vandeheii]MDN4602518.1 ABC transporter substrate-binding protein [Paenibacillus vandeheii]
MTGVRSKWWTGLMILVLVIGIIGCSSQAEETIENKASAPAVTEEQPENSAAETQVISTVNGDVEIPVNPKRIVTQGYLADFLALGVKPVGAPDYELESPYVLDLVEGVADIGRIDGGSVEKILSIQPDLIVTVGGDEKLNEQYRKIAPTLIIPYGTYDNVHEEITAFGKIINKQKEAQDWLSQFEVKVKTAKESIQGLVKEGTTFSNFSLFGKEWYINGDGVNRGGQAIYQQLGLKAPDIVQKELIDQDKDTVAISEEKLADYAGDYIFLDLSNGGSLDEGSPVWSSLDAVKNNRVFKLDGERFWPYDPLAVEAQVQEIADMIKERFGKTEN